ncbi:15527_t:CDS:2 [Dentiscutata erythropus]|uniref:15527_t:CDS:1 n=1 Tax=Dentiscutata erythropus TaxID=1348616 RepID=A0A9N9EWW5_9GLOM|nr:15527_t:CDS:2 [Dentiscutata erythropus]
MVPKLRLQYNVTKEFSLRYTILAILFFIFVDIIVIFFVILTKGKTLSCSPQFRNVYDSESCQQKLFTSGETFATQTFIYSFLNSTQYTGAPLSNCKINFSKLFVHGIPTSLPIQDWRYNISCSTSNFSVALNIVEPAYTDVGDKVNDQIRGLFGVNGLQTATCGGDSNNNSYPVNSYQILNGGYYVYSNAPSNGICYASNDDPYFRPLDTFLNNTIQYDLNNFGIIPTIYQCQSCILVWNSFNVILLEILTSSFAIMGVVYTITLIFLKNYYLSKISKSTQ